MKQRLLGAAVLIALAIIFVPMFLSGPGTKTNSDTTNLQAPPTPDRRFQERTLSLDLPRADGGPAAAVNPDAALDPNRITTVDTASAPKPEPAAEQIAVETPPPPVAPAAGAAAMPESALPTPVETASEKALDGLPGTAANGSFFVHLGDYGARKNAADLAAALNKSGYAAFTEESAFGGKPTLRVRVGPFANRAAAEATRLRISEGTFRAPATVVQNASDAKAPDAVVTKPAAPKSDASANIDEKASASANAGGWVVQLNAFSDVDDANKLRDSVREAGFPAYVDKVSREGRTLWRVRVGPQASRSSAQAVQTRLRERLKKDGVVVANP